jgi:ribonucleoside-diphosphate reductase alpha chain
MEDSLESIYNVNDLSAKLSKWGGGIGISCSKVRAANSPIRGFKGLSTGIIPWLKNLNNTALSVDQLAQRKGAFAVYLDVWHKDVFDFLQLKSPTGDPRMRCYDLFTGLVLNDVFMKQVEKKQGKYYLFCPHEIKTVMGFSLEDFYGQEFENKYWECVDNKELPRIEVKAMDIIKELIKSATETGTPYLMFRDICNSMNPNKHTGMIYSSNVCSEILQNMKANGPLEEKIIHENGKTYVAHIREAGSLVVCNLSSLNLKDLYNNDDKLKHTIRTAIRAMDNVIDLNYYPISEAQITNQSMRPIGLGVSNYHYVLAKEGIAWNSKEHLDFMDKLFEKINFYAIEASMELSKEKGAYSLFKGSDWDNGNYFKLRNYNSPEWQELAEKVHKYGLRNGYLMAIAPTASTSIIIGSTAGIDPIYNKFFMEQKKNGAVPTFAPDVESLWWFYQEAHNVSQEWSIKANATRARHIDQSQSMNLYITSETKATDILKLYMLAWKLGVRTIYYTRSRSTEIEDCLSCSS